ncbi:glycosyltransferase family 4 protein [Pseudarthrobacter sp. MDT3-26]|uniref:glycosyltransferase family 4 protein n=1 Tax=Pseudarthrobacter raffinosi TaxID=2953651 RepID=UPI00208EA24C|nr:glycosyltransferase family 4 protein [Pseudarthrobacter sp. MDT3-26]MCO4264402.1 glycosyltransferase family 4 protein [Pseudarthrobacter sp. MDT3-26]
MHGFYSSETPSGENAVVQMQLEALESAGHEVRLFAVYTDDFSLGVTYKLRTAINVATGDGYDPSDELKAFQPDVVHIHNLFPNFSTRWLSGWTGPVTTTVHNFRPLCASGNLFRDGASCTLCPTSGQIHGVIHKCYKGSTVATVPLAIRNRRGLHGDSLLQRADRIIFLSDRALKTYADYGLDPSKATIIPNFVRPTEIKAGEDSASTAWLYAGRLTSDKGILSLVQAWPSDVRLDVYGDGPEMRRLQELAGPSVVLHGAVFRDTVLKAVSAAQGVVIPSRWAEGMPTIYIEALAAGVPVLAKSGNSAADDVLISRAGLVFNEWNEVPGLIDSIRLSHIEIRRAAIDRYHENFTEPIWTSRIEKLYSEFITHSL